MQTISGYLWIVTGPGGEEYYWYTSTEDYPELPEGYAAEPQGGGLINIAVLDNATVKDGVVRTYVPDTLRQVQALKVLLCPEGS
jgi:hypothetical protein